MSSATATRMSASSAPPPVDDSESKQDAALLGKISEFARGYEPPPSKTKKDTLANRFIIERGNPLPAFNSRTANAYNVSDQSGEFKRLYALVINPGFVPRYKAIEALKTFRHPNLLPLIASGAVEFSQPNEERFVLIFERPEGKKLSEVIDGMANGFNEYFIINNIISPLISMIHALSEQGVTHGSIHINNIYYGNALLVGECLSEPCGYSQPFPYEPIERMMCSEAGKGEGNSSHDYYALAVVVLHMLFGTKHFAGVTQPSLIRSILKDGPYAAMVRNEDVSLLMDEFFRGTIGQDSDVRWNYRYLKSWVDGRRSSAIVNRNTAEILKPFEYYEGDAEIMGSSRRELANEFYRHWETLPSVLLSGKLVSWMAINLRNKELVTEISRICKVLSQLSGKQEWQQSEQCMRLLQLLDPIGPLRLRPLTMHVDGVHTLCAEYFRTNAQNELRALTQFIEYDMVSYWTQLPPHDNRETRSALINDLLLKLDRLRLLVRNPGLGFGVERMLYELNPDMPCQSPLMAGGCVTTLPALLKKLDALAPSLHSQQDPMDRHIAAFICQKLNLQGEVKLHELAATPSLATNSSMIALRLLSLAYQRNSSLELPGLTHWLAHRILPALSVIRSKSLRQKIKSTLVARAQTGSLSALDGLIIDGGYSNADKKGFKRAADTYSYNTQRIKDFRTPAVIDHDSLVTGAVVAKSLAYVGFIVTFLVNIWQFL